GGDALQHLLREGLVIRDAGLAHEARISGETLDERVRVEAQDAGLVRAIGEKFYGELLKWILHVLKRLIVALPFQSALCPPASRIRSRSLNSVEAPRHCGHAFTRRCTRENAAVFPAAALRAR